MFDVLTYEKGASVLRMLELHVGPDVFRDGVRDYLRTHAYGNADSKGLWASLGKVAKQPVPEFMDSWIFQPGYPLVTAKLSGDAELVLAQQRFAYLGNDEPLKQRWQIPIQIRIKASDRTEHRRLLLTQSETRLSLPPGVRQVLINEGGSGFYRVRYESLLLQQLLDDGVDCLRANRAIQSPQRFLGHDGFRPHATSRLSPPHWILHQGTKQERLGCAGRLLFIFEPGYHG